MPADIHAHILIVEDEAAIAQLIAINLRHAGWQTTIARDGHDADLFIATTVPHLIVLDWMLPGLSGPALVRKWRSQEKTRNIPIIMLTGRSDEGDKVTGLDAGADDYLTKPFSTQELLARVRAQLRRVPGNTASGGIQVGALSLDPQSHRVHYRGTELRVGPTEFKMLHSLMRAPERVHSRAQLLDKVWGNESFVEERTVDVHIKRLRQALGEAGLLIETVRGAGYRITGKPSGNN